MKICSANNRFPLQDHLTSHDKSKGKFLECDHCKKKFIGKSVLAAHIRGHMGVKPYKCRYCQVGFRIASTQKAHERLHTGETPYHCPLCENKYTQLSNLKSHFKNNHKGLVFYDVYKRSDKLRPWSRYM
jgi:zinc finger protein 362/384